MPNNNLGKRIKAKRESKGLSQTQLATKAGVSQGAISQLENGTSENSKHLPKIAQALGTTTEQLTSSRYDIEDILSDYVMAGGSNSGQTPVAGEYVEIPQYDVSGSCGDGAMVGDVTVKGGLVFKKGWLESLGVQPANLATIYAQGDSMSPTIEDGQVLLVDTSEIVPRSSKIYLVCIDEQLYIKRLINIFDGWLMRSDNQDKHRYPDINLSPERMVNIDIQGRIIWKAGTL